MKKAITILTAALLTATLWAQSPEKMSYQSVIRDADEELVVNQNIGMQISILQTTSGGTAVYTETHMPTTNANGLVSLEIGAGTVISGDFSTIDWANDIYFIKTETDPTGGSNYSITGTSQLLSSPYALHSKTADTFTGTLTELDPRVPEGTQAGDMQYWNGTEWVILSATVNEGATLQMISGIPTWTGGTLPATVPDAPIIGTAIAGNARASVPYTAPAFDGGSPISSYTATSNPGNFTGTLNREGSGTITVTGLTNGTAYTFTVTATNAIGISLPSAPSNSVTPSTSGISTVTNPITGKIWMDRNLGATRVAINDSDVLSYGDLYQWGRGTDGHEKRNSAITDVLSNSDNPGHGDFIITGSNPGDWRSPKNDELWQGVNGANNPCPSGYRVPTQADWAAERDTWSSNNSQGAFDSYLKLPMAGRRDNIQGIIFGGGTSGNYWSNTVEGTNSVAFYFNPNFFAWSDGVRALARSVRCIKED